MMSSLSTPNPSGKVVLSIPYVFRTLVMKRLRMASRCDFQWHLKPEPKMDDRVKGERELTKFLIEETRRVGKQMGVEGDKIEAIVYDVTESKQLAEWFYKIDFIRSLGTDFDFGMYCPEEADVLPIIYGCAPDGSNFKIGLDGILTQWIETAVRRAIQPPSAPTFTVKESVKAWLGTTEDKEASQLLQKGPKPENYYQDELKEYAEAHGIQCQYTTSRQLHWWRCKLVAVGGDIKGGELIIFGHKGKKEDSREDAARKMLRNLRTSVGIGDDLERSPTPEPEGPNVGSVNN
ncbi:hypothetical protein TWF281_004838 [Arthrobotrys megalospora]